MATNGASRRVAPTRRPKDRPRIIRNASRFRLYLWNRSRLQRKTKESDVTKTKGKKKKGCEKKDEEKMTEDMENEREREDGFKNPHELGKAASSAVSEPFEDEDKVDAGSEPPFVTKRSNNPASVGNFQQESRPDVLFDFCGGDEDSLMIPRVYVYVHIAGEERGTSKRSPQGVKTPRNAD
ncbi:hypothetical protein ALC57_13775 [Trachymyrmex cornetzi]|uniref:Uncharacterized protein n=1 Tax=Trachymyrmex cornetzi TaxID=471704 RepID=A0A151IZ81_9HYME|nr:hypothetical protein ALC57_13775 [Trachymyrmex cornetzi]